MKIRNGFVSNSSTCSFLIAMALVKDKKEFDKRMPMLENDHDVTFYTGKEIRDIIVNKSIDADDENQFYRDYNINDLLDDNINVDYFSAHSEDTFMLYDSSFGEFHDYTWQDPYGHEHETIADDEAIMIVENETIALKRLVAIGVLTDLRYDYKVMYA